MTAHKEGLSNDQVNLLTGAIDYLQGSEETVRSLHHRVAIDTVKTDSGIEIKYMQMPEASNSDFVGILKLVLLEDGTLDRDIETILEFKIADDGVELSAKEAIEAHPGYSDGTYKQSDFDIKARKFGKLLRRVY